MIYKIVALCIVAILIVVNYAAFVAASRADERAERMYEEWRRKRDEIDRCGCADNGIAT